MPYEHKSENVASEKAFRGRLARHLLIAAVFLLFSLGIGTAGLHYADPRIPWLDALMNSAMLLGGMGPTINSSELTDAAKWFSTCYALYAGLVFVLTSGWIIAPVFHRILHKFHADEQDKL